MPTNMSSDLRDNMAKTLEEFCTPLSSEQMAVIERHSGMRKTMWFPSPIEAHRKALTHRFNPEDKTNFMCCPYPSGYMTPGCGYDITVRLALEALSNTCIGFIVDDALLLAHRPQVIRVEDLGDINRGIRLHCEDGPAVVWGNHIRWYIHAVEVDEQVVMRPETQTFQQIMVKEKNEERRRIRMERYGMTRLMEHGKLLDRRRNDVECTIEKLVQLRRMRFLACCCPSTGRVYALQVPLEITSCEQAQAWLWSGSSLTSTVPGSGLTPRLNIIGRS